MSSTPQWVKKAVFYQIFPDRFCKSSRNTDLVGLQLKPWGSAPTEEGFQGGDLFGIVERLDYIQSLGVNALYLTPVFASASNHRYHPFDYYNVDPLLGGNAALRLLIDDCHARDMKVVLDGVFNHASRGFWAFHHILENGGDSPYLDWFHIHGWPLRPYSSDANNHHNYTSWWNLPALPKFNTKNPGVREYLLGVAKHWIKFGADGWRIDAADEIRDVSFWRAFRKVVKEANPEAYLCGEDWGIAPKWLRGDRFDGLMNYPLAVGTLEFFGQQTLRPQYFPDPKELLKPCTGQDLAERIDEIHQAYPWESVLSMMNNLGSHDTARIFWVLRDNVTALEQCILFQMTMPGAPCIYYGDEIGMSSAGLPHCREAFPWEEEASWNDEVLHIYREAVSLRHKYKCLQIGHFEMLNASQNTIVYSRSLENQQVIVAFNAGSNEQLVKVAATENFSNGKTFKHVHGNGSFATQAGNTHISITLPARGSLVLCAEG